jgi:hypothetical protein
MRGFCDVKCEWRRRGVSSCNFFLELTDAPLHHEEIQGFQEEMAELLSDIEK